jgi:geranylgeranyl pyrophosphate synthase
MNKDRKIIMEETREIMEIELKKIQDFLGLHPKFSKVIFELPEKQIQKLSIRGSFVRMIYDYIIEQMKEEYICFDGVNNEIFSAKLPLIHELIICIQYYENQILDGKGGVIKDKKMDIDKVKLNLLSSHYLKDVVYQYSIIPNNSEQTLLIHEAIRKMFQFVDIGQLMEHHWSSLQNFHNGLPSIPTTNKEIDIFFDINLIDELWEDIKSAGIDSSKEVFVRFYLHRVYLTSAAMFVIGAELVMDLLNYNGTERSNILRLAGHYGMMCQFVNDNNDFLPAEFGQQTLAKNAEDAFSDIKNDNITLPMFFFFQENPSVSLADLVNSPGMSICRHFEKSLDKYSIPFAEKIGKDLERYLNLKNKVSPCLINLGTLASRTRFLSNFKDIFAQKSKYEYSTPIPNFAHSSTRLEQRSFGRRSSKSEYISPCTSR